MAHQRQTGGCGNGLRSTRLRSRAVREKRILHRLLRRQTARACSPSLQSVTFALGDVDREPGRRMDHVFPDHAVSSSLSTEDGETAEMGLAGNEVASSACRFSAATRRPAAPSSW
jgi:hypothetical protein